MKSVFQIFKIHTFLWEDGKLVAITWGSTFDSFKTIDRLSKINLCSFGEGKTHLRHTVLSRGAFAPQMCPQTRMPGRSKPVPQKFHSDNEFSTHAIKQSTSLTNCHRKRPKPPGTTRPTFYRFQKPLHNPEPTNRALPVSKTPSDDHPLPFLKMIDFLLGRIEFNCGSSRFQKSQISDEQCFFSCQKADFRWFLGVWRAKMMIRTHFEEVALFATCYFCYFAIFVICDFWNVCLQATSATWLWSVLEFFDLKKQPSSRKKRKEKETP